VTLLRFAGFELDELRAELRGADGVPIRLRPKPFVMLMLFLANAGRVLSKQELMQGVWANVHVAEDSLFQCIREIRTALGDDDRRVIKLVSGRGYLFDAEVTKVARPSAGAAEAGNAAPAGQAERSDAGSDASDPAAAPKPSATRFPLGAAAAVALFAVLGLAVAAGVMRSDTLTPTRSRPTIAVTIVDASGDAPTAAMAANVAGDLIEGLAKVNTIRVLSPPPPPRPTLASAATAVAASPSADIVVEGRLQKNGTAWVLRAQATLRGEVRWSTSISVATDGVDAMLQQSRLAGGFGHELAQYVNTLLYPGESADNRAAASRAKIVVEQATAYINHTSRERFAAAQAMLEKGLAAEPDNVDLEAALAAQLLRGIQTTWYHGAEGEAAERRAQELLERALRAEPQYLPVLETYCRFLQATNRFAESLVACANALTFDPWNGLVRFNMGMSLALLGRFSEALATFEQADRYDTPQVSRWTWLLGAGLVLVLTDRDQEALPWLQRSLAITPGTGRTHLLLAVAYQRLGRYEEAKAAMAECLKLRPGSTAENVGLPVKNASPIWRAAAERATRAEIAAGLPEH
jgi:DNA-binding winged helix-turn-helix (wHTH) protein/tetratricopeptide (TPR) repeat protein